jgi:hypothetical protein
MPPRLKIFGISHSSTRLIERRLCSVSDLLSHAKVASALLVIVVVFTDCSMFGPYEEYREEQGRTVYRSADQTTASDVDTMRAASQQKVPGE